MPSPTVRTPWVVRRLTGPWHRRHPRLFVGIELLVCAWIIVAGIMLCTVGDWAGTALFALAGLVLWFLYEFWRSVQA